MSLSKVLVQCVLSGSLALAAHAAVAQTSSDSPIQWAAGAMYERGRPVIVQIDLPANPQLGEVDGRLRVQAPWSCGFDLEYMGDHPDGTAKYALKGSGQGRCTVWRDGYFSVNKTQSGGLQLTIFDRTGASRQVIDLTGHSK